MRELLLPDEHPYTHRHSSIDQFKNYLSVYKQGGWAPIVFDQLDGIVCEDIKTHPVVIYFPDPNDVGYVFPEKHCSYTSEKFIYFDKEEVEQKPLPACFGGNGEFYEEFIKANAFVNFDNDASIGTVSTKQLRTGLDYCLASETLPAVE